MFILRKQRMSDVAEAFRRYRDFVHKNKAKFPKTVFELASSDWYFNPSEHKCPHDAWLESFAVEESSAGDRQEIRKVNIRMVLLAAYHDGYIEFFYDGVTRYLLEGSAVTRGHNDWKFDEFRLTDEGHVVHEIEWARLSKPARWIIEANNVTYTWRDKKG